MTQEDIQQSIPASYNAKSIEVLMDMEAVRKRPAMYIGDTGMRGLHHLVEEIVANSIDEAMGGYCTEVHVKLNADNSVTVIDNGRGIPVDLHEEMGLPALEVIMTVLHAGGKFSHNSYKVSGGLHGVGVSVVNALSEWCEVQVKRDGHVYRQEYERGETRSQLEKIGTATSTGTTVTFKPDSQIFDVSEFNPELIKGRLRELAFLNKGLAIKFISAFEPDAPEAVFCYEGGIAAFVELLNEGKPNLHSDIIYFDREQDGINVEVALQYNSTYNENVITFANNIHTHGGGTHLSGFRAALTRSFNNYAKTHNLVKNGEMPQGEDMREGLTAVVSIKIPDPQFEGQTKDKLGNRDAQTAVEVVTGDLLSTYLEEHPKVAKDIVNKALMAAAARSAARKARDLARRKSALSSGNLPVKLADCRTRSRDESELFIVEGDSAGGNAKQCRDSRFQAILPLRGKILNIEKARLDKMLANEEIRTLISTLGTSIGTEEFNIEGLRYGKIIIMTDADVDGLHIRTLLLTFFFRHMRELISTGRVFVAQPPLFRVLKRKKEEQYFIDDRDFNAALAELGLDGAVFSVAKDQRELTNDQLRELIDILTKIEHLEQSLNTRGITLPDYFKMRNEQGHLPMYRVLVDGDEKLVYTEPELNEYRMSLQTEHGGELEVAGEPEEVQENTLLISRIHESNELQRLLVKLEEIGFDLATYFPKQDPEAEPDYTMMHDNECMPVNGLKAVTETIRSIGEKNIVDIQRYKGLGEMNPNQLGETTMDPGTRTLLRVCLEDALQAENLFALLMGADVKPRREYIEKHALEAKNLDIHG